MSEKGCKLVSQTSCSLVVELKAAISLRERPERCLSNNNYRQCIKY